MIDLHTHHERCGHAHGPLDAYAASAVTRGVTILGFSDHAPLFASRDDHSAPGIQMAISDFEGYLAECDAVRARFANELDVRIGVEADFIAGTEATYRERLARAELDYVIGSVHAFDGHHIYDPSTWPAGVDAADLHLRYHQAIQAAVGSKMFDVLGHLDALKVFAPAPVNHDVDRALAATLDAVAKSGIVVEINTSGLRKCGELFPAPSLVAELHRRGVRFTFGSDAHHPDEVAYGWGQVVELLRSLGVDDLVTFVAREARPVRVAA